MIKERIQNQFGVNSSTLFELLETKGQIEGSLYSMPLFHDRFRKTFQDRKIFVGKREVIGGRTAHTVKSDTVAFIAGAHVPFILSMPQDVVEK